MKAAKRHSLPRSDFVYPDREGFPINDKAHARNALARAAQSKTSGSYETVARKVRAKYPDIQTKGSSRASTTSKKTTKTATAKKAAARKGKKT